MVRVLRCHTMVTPSPDGPITTDRCHFGGFRWTRTATSVKWGLAEKQRRHLTSCNMRVNWHHRGAPQGTVQTAQRGVKAGGLAAATSKNAPGDCVLRSSAAPPADNARFSTFPTRVQGETWLVHIHHQRRMV